MSYNSCIYKADGSFVCKTTEKTPSKEDFTFRDGVVVYFNRNDYRQMAATKLTSNGTNVINAREYMFDRDSGFTYYMFLNPNGNLEVRTYAGDNLVHYVGGTNLLQGGSPIYGKLDANGVFSLYASKKPDMSEEYVYWSTSTNARNANDTYTLELLDGVITIKNSRGSVIWSRGHSYVQEQACVRPAGWCTHGGSFYRTADCRGNGFYGDHVCTDTRNNRWVIMRSNGCANWPYPPSGVCPNGGI